MHEKLREEGVNEAWGLGTSHVEPCEVAVDMTEIRPNAAPVAAATHCSAMNKLYTFDAGMPGEEDRHRDWRAEQFRSSGWRQPLRVRTGIAGKFWQRCNESKRFARTSKSRLRRQRCTSRSPILHRRPSFLGPANPNASPRIMSRRAEGDAPRRVLARVALTRARRRTGTFASGPRREGSRGAGIDIPASPDQVWQLIGGFNSLPE